MSLTIPGNGASQAIYLRQNGGVIEYSVGATSGGSYTPISSGQWPVTINNTPSPGPSSILRVIATNNLTLTSSYGNTNGYLIAGSTYITFDGSGNTITLDGITSYGGFIQNGTGSVNGNANVVVQNFTTDISGVSSLASSAGWLCQRYFGIGGLGNSITGCTNRGVISSNNSGGIAGNNAANSAGSVTITGCTNSGAISGTQTGGIIGSSAGSGPGSSVTITNCTNTGTISGSGSSGGIAGGSAASSSGSVIITGCANSGVINSVNGGGIVGGAAARINGSITITNCANSGNITNLQAGGILGNASCENDGIATITNCFNTGDITTGGDYSGGITGNRFGYNTNQTCTISECYNTGVIGANQSGGIVGANIGYTSNALYTASVDISNCYSLGTIASGSGGICGGYSGSSYLVKANINITNSYSSGAITSGGQGLVAASLTPANINLTTPNTYVANNSWNDTTANASLTGDPLGVGISNKGPTWTSISAGTPYFLSSFFSITNPTQIYIPNSVSTSSTTYSSAAGSYSPGIYSIQSSSQVGSTLTTNVAAIAGTSPIYYGYYNNIYTLTNTGTNPGSITPSINASSGVLSFTLPDPPYPCFLEGTKILCFENDQEVYKLIENLRKGDLVKTIYNGYMPICMIGTTAIYNPGNDYRFANRLYKCSKEKYPALFEDLYITGCHSILVPSMTDDEWENTKAVNGDIFVTDNHFRLVACADEKAEPYEKEGFMNIYHIALEHNDYYMNYGIYANGLLVESCSKRYLTELSNMRILGEADCSVSENVDKVLIRQLVETY